MRCQAHLPSKQPSSTGAPMKTAVIVPSRAAAAIGAGLRLGRSAALEVGAAQAQVDRARAAALFAMCTIHRHCRHQSHHHCRHHLHLPHHLPYRHHHRLPRCPRHRRRHCLHHLLRLLHLPRLHHRPTSPSSPSTLQIYSRIRRPRCDSMGAPSPVAILSSSCQLAAQTASTLPNTWTRRKAAWSVPKIGCV